MNPFWRAYFSKGVGSTTNELSWDFPILKKMFHVILVVTRFLRILGGKKTKRNWGEKTRTEKTFWTGKKTVQYSCLGLFYRGLNSSQFMWGEDLINHCFWIPFVNNQVFFCCVVHICPWGLYLWPTYWWTLADYRQATTNSSGWGKPVDVLVVFIGGVYISMFILVYSWSYIQIFWERIKNDEFRIEVLFYFFQFSFLWFRLVFFWVWPLKVSKKNSQNVLCSWIFEAHPHMAEAGTLAGNLSNTRKNSVATWRRPLNITPQREDGPMDGKLEDELFLGAMFLATQLWSLTHGPKKVVFPKHIWCSLGKKTITY